MPARFDLRRLHVILRRNWRGGVAYVARDGRGLAGTLALHGLFLLLVLGTLLHRTAPPLAPQHVVPIEVVQVGDTTTAPPAPVKAKIPTPFVPHTVPRPPASANKPEGTSPTGTKPQPDDLETRLNALAHLKAPESNTQPLDRPSASDATTSNDAEPGNETAYAVRDLIRAQVLRKWNFDVAALGAKGFVIALRVTVVKGGRVEKAEILDRERYTRDALYRDIALSARNAVLLASPLTLPEGSVIGDGLTVTLSLNPRDTLK
ncbi:MAG TPA: hypothetical protein VG387_21565 [Rhizomicrobium sp.]|jgi:hypothetical protein|nr:hypothetical protein [Rhizomicrobium sp.]